MFCKLHEIKNTDDLFQHLLEKLFFFLSIKPGFTEQFEKESTKQMGIYYNAGWRTSKNSTVFLPIFEAINLNDIVCTEHRSIILGAVEQR